MYVLLIVIHLLTAFLMVGAILLQSGKGAEIGATFGGSSQTIFGGRGAATFLSKFTWGCVVVFMMTSLGLAILSKERSLGTSLKLPSPPPISTSTQPAAASPAQGSTPAAAPGAAAPASAPAASSSSTSSAPVGREGMPPSPASGGVHQPPAAASTVPSPPAKP
jgi:preprotein translocase subunit SecG